jgi:hypothetical protein
MDKRENENNYKMLIVAATIITSFLTVYKHIFFVHKPIYFYILVNSFLSTLKISVDNI